MLLVHSTLRKRSAHRRCVAAELHVVRCNDLLAVGSGALDMLSCMPALRRVYLNGLPTMVDVEVRLRTRDHGKQHRQPLRTVSTLLFKWVIHQPTAMTGRFGIPGIWPSQSTSVPDYRITRSHLRHMLCNDVGSTLVVAS